MTDLFQWSRAGRRAGERFTRLSLEQLETRDVPSVGSLVVASAIVHSNESYGVFITSEYSRYLNRLPDTGGFNFFMAQMQLGVAPEVIEAEFVASTEYVANHGGTTNGWVIGLYHDLLGRLPSSSELNFWTVAMANGMTPNQVAVSFTTSIERDIVVVTNQYVTLLGRAPDTAGLNFFVNALRNGSNRLAVESAIISSNEFIVDHGSNSSFFVIGAYEDVLLRSPSNLEIVFWQQTLAANGGL
jgi:Domain of unknown function (DUF4214)